MYVVCCQTTQEEAAAINGFNLLPDLEVLAVEVYSYSISISIVSLRQFSNPAIFLPLYFVVRDIHYNVLCDFM